ncbi:MAG: vitamin K epoxide reductase family protein [Planctomycetaceae bacterium]
MALSKATITDELGISGAQLIWGLRLLCGAALLVSGYLAVTALRSEQVAGCGGGVVFDCGHVLTSRWSRIFGLPVSVPAVLLYGGMLGALCFCRSAKSASVRRRAWDAVVTGAMAAGLAAVWFVSLQMLAIGHLCLYCLAAHTCGLAMCGAILWWRPVGNRRTALLSGVSAAGVSLMIGAQLLATPPATYTIETHTPEQQPADRPLSPEFESEFEAPGQPTDAFEVFEPFGPPPGVPTSRQEPKAAPAPASDRRARTMHASFVPMAAIRAIVAMASGETESAETLKESSATSSTAPVEPTPAPERRLVLISGGKTKLDVRHWPLIGSPEAKYVFVEMYDYTCAHCRATHQAILGAKQRYGDDLAIVSLPVPLNRACNPTVKTDHPSHADACEVARIAVAVWRVNTKLFGQFHDWLFEPTQARTATEARRYAAQLVGEAALAQELARPFASQYIAKHVELYQRAGAGAVPKLLFQDSTVVGEVRSTQALCDMIEREHRP